MDDSLTESLAYYLWPRGAGPEEPTVYSVLDGARDPRIYPMLLDSGMPHKCLYAGDLSEELLAVAPHIVKLTPKSPFTQSLIQKSWGKSWGIYVTVARPAMLEDVRKTMRRYLKVMDDEGRQLLFRFYDPRVLRSYMPTCTAEQLPKIFGPILEFIVEAENQSEFWSYKKRGENVDTSLVAIGLVKDERSAN